MSKREILRREQERESLKMKRRKITYVAVGVLALSLIIFGTILAINKSRQGPAIETSQDTISKAIVSISKSVYDKVGPGSSELQVTKIGNKPDKDGKVKLFYVGSEFCPILRDGKTPSRGSFVSIRNLQRAKRHPVKPGRKGTFQHSYDYF